MGGGGGGSSLPCFSLLSTIDSLLCAGLSLVLSSYPRAVSKGMTETETETETVKATHISAFATSWLIYFFSQYCLQ